MTVERESQATADSRTSTVMEELKTSTADAHTAVETSAFQRDLAAGRLPRELYVAYLGQLLHVHQALEVELQSLLEQEPDFTSIVRPEQFRVEHLRRDLADLGAAGPNVQLGSTATIVTRIESSCNTTPVAVLGHHYVLEGSTNGARYFVRSVQRAYGLQDRVGLRYLDPYGADQPQRWAEFKSGMNQVRFTSADRSAMVGAARDMFEGIHRIGDALFQQRRS
jgi:heme oxygenase